MEDLGRFLNDHPFFKGLKREYMQLIVGCAKNVVIQEGQFIFREGDAANEFFVIRHGSVTLETLVPSRGTVTIQTIGDGDVLGWSWLFPPYQWHFDARAIETVRALSLDGKCLRKKCEADPALGYELMQRFAAVMMKRLQETRLQMMDVYGEHR